MCAGQVSRFLSLIGEKVYGRSKSSDDGSKRSSAGAVICDAVAVCCAIDRSTVTAYEMCNVEVEVEKDSLAFGATVCDFGHHYEGVERLRNVKWVQEIDVQRYSDILEKALVP